MHKGTRFSARASLFVFGMWMRGLGIWGVGEEWVQINQKAIDYQPLEKLMDAFINFCRGSRSR